MYTYTYEKSAKSPSAIDDIRLKIAEIELVRAKLDAYHTATGLSLDGTRAMSEGKAKREILGMTDAQIKDELLAQFIETKVRSEIAQAPDLLDTSFTFEGLIDNSNELFQTEKPKDDSRLMIEALHAHIKILEDDITLVYQEITSLLRENAKAFKMLEISVASIKVKK